MLKKIFNAVYGACLSVADVARGMNKKRHRRLLLILPILLVIALFLAITSSSGVLAPFVYPLF